MKTLVLSHLASSLLMAASALAQEVDLAKSKPVDIYAAAIDDRESKKYDEALRKLEWLFANGHIVDPAYDPARLSFAIATWARLAEHYKPAREALDKLSADKRRAIFNARESNVLGLMEEFVAINDAENSRLESVALFKKLIGDGKEGLARAAFPAIKELLFKQEEYVVLSRFLDLNTEFNQRTDHFRKVIAVVKDKPQHASILSRLYREAIIDLVEMAVALNKTEDTQRIISGASSVLKDEGFSARLSQIAERRKSN